MRYVRLAPRPAVKTQTRHLLHADGRFVKIGDKVTSFRDETATVTGWPHNGRNRVWVKWDDKHGGSNAEYFVSVFDLEWEDEKLERQQVAAYVSEGLGE